MNSQETVSTYRAMAELTGQMLRAASINDWELLATLERECARHARLLQEQEPPRLDGAERGQKLEAIRKMLQDDRQIRDLTMPWMAKLSALISSTGNQRKLQSAYGA
jgi:flagellar protein FliT